MNRLVYIIEDEEQHFESMKDHLVPLGFTCRRFAKDLAAVVKAARQVPPVAVIVDIFLEAGSGPQIGTDCVAELKAMPSAPAVILSSKWPIESQKQYNAHFDAVVEKERDARGHLLNAAEIAQAVLQACA